MTRHHTVSPTFQCIPSFSVLFLQSILDTPLSPEGATGHNSGGKKAFRVESDLQVQHDSTIQTFFTAAHKFQVKSTSLSFITAWGLLLQKTCNDHLKHNGQWICRITSSACETWRHLQIQKILIAREQNLETEAWKTYPIWNVDVSAMCRRARICGDWNQILISCHYWQIPVFLYHVTTDKSQCSYIMSLLTNPSVLISCHYWQIPVFLYHVTTDKSQCSYIMSLFTNPMCHSKSNTEY